MKEVIVVIKRKDFDTECYLNNTKKAIEFFLEAIKSDDKIINAYIMDNCTKDIYATYDKYEYLGGIRCDVWIQKSLTE